MRLILACLLDLDYICVYLVFLSFLWFIGILEPEFFMQVEKRMQREEHGLLRGGGRSQMEDLTAH